MLAVMGSRNTWWIRVVTMARNQRGQALTVKMNLTVGSIGSGGIGLRRSAYLTS